VAASPAAAAMQRCRGMGRAGAGQQSRPPPGVPSLPSALPPPLPPLPSLRPPFPPSLRDPVQRPPFPPSLRDPVQQLPLLRKPPPPLQLQRIQLQQQRLPPPPPPQPQPQPPHPRAMSCNTNVSRATGWTASMSSPYVGLPSGLSPGTRPRARAFRLVLDSGLGAAAVRCRLSVHLVDQRAIVDQERKMVARSIALTSRARSSFFSAVLRMDILLDVRRLRCGRGTCAHHPP
jgi:hypothetical protein